MMMVMTMIYNMYHT